MVLERAEQEAERNVLHEKGPRFNWIVGESLSIRNHTERWYPSLGLGVLAIYLSVFIIIIGWFTRSYVKHDEGHGN